MIRRPSVRGIAFAFLAIFAASVPLEAIGQLGALGSAARIAGILAAAGGAAALCTDLPVRRADGFLFAFGAFVMWVALSYFWSENPVNTLSRTATYAQLLFLAWLIWQEVRTSRACALLMQAYVGGCAIACIDAILKQKPAHAGVPRFSVGDPNDFGVVVVIGMVMAYHVVITSRSRWTRLACLAFLPLGTVAVFETASRTAVVALFLAAFIAVCDRRNLKPWRVVVITFVVGVVVVAVLHTVSSAQLNRIGSVKAEATSGTLDQRTSVWSLSLTTFAHHPILGIGADTFRDVVQDATGHAAPAHNSFLGVLVDLGLPGLLLFGAIFVALVPSVKRLPPRLRRTWVTITLIWLVGAATLSWEHRKITWFLAFLLVAQSDAARRERRADRERELAGEHGDERVDERADAAADVSAIESAPLAGTPG